VGFEYSEATVGTFVKSVRPMIRDRRLRNVRDVLRRPGSCARTRANDRKADKAIAVRMTSVSHRSDILDFDFLNFFRRPRNRVRPPVLPVRSHGDRVH